MRTTKELSPIEEKERDRREEESDEEEEEKIERKEKNDIQLNTRGLLNGTKEKREERRRGRKRGGRDLLTIHHSAAGTD